MPSTAYGECNRNRLIAVISLKWLNSARFAFGIYNVKFIMILHLNTDQVRKEIPKSKILEVQLRICSSRESLETRHF